MIGLMINVRCSEQSASAFPDQALHFGSFVAISSRTLLSTSTPRQALKRARNPVKVDITCVVDVDGAPRE